MRLDMMNTIVAAQDKEEENFQKVKKIIGEMSYYYFVHQVTKKGERSVHFTKGTVLSFIKDFLYKYMINGENIVIKSKEIKEADFTYVGVDTDNTSTTGKLERSDWWEDKIMFTLPIKRYLSVSIQLNFIYKETRYNLVIDVSSYEHSKGWSPYELESFNVVSIWAGIVQCINYKGIS